MPSITEISGPDRAQLEARVNAFNATINNGRVADSELGKDDFLQILVTQLSHQDPTQPMQDREFIAQMAQFSTLEQITNMNQGFTDMAGSLKANRAIDLLGRSVELLVGDNVLEGQVDQISLGSDPAVRVQGTYYSLDQIQRITE